MPRRIIAGAAGFNLLFGPPGTPAPPFGGRGSPSARAATISALTLGEVAEMLFEGAAGPNGVALDEIRGNTVAQDDGAGVIVLGGDQFSHHSVDSIQFNNSDQNYVRVFTTIPTHYVFELWFRDTLTDGDVSVLVGQDNNPSNHIGRGNTVGFNWPSNRNDFNAILQWESEIDLSGDGLIHQLLEFRDTAGGNDFVVCIDGMPVAIGSTGGTTVLSPLPSFNDKDDATNSDRYGGEAGSFTTFNNGSNLSLRDARELYETSCLDGRDMLTSPRWFVLDSSNVVIPDPILAKQVDLGDVTDATGIRSGAIRRSKLTGGGDRVYFELEILEQGDDATATLLGLRRFAEGGPVGGDSDNTDEAIYLKAGLLFDGANVVLPTGTGDGDQDATVLDDPITGQIYRFAMEWVAASPTQFFIGDDLRWKGRTGITNPAVGLESGAILDGALSASTFLDADHAARHARLNNAFPNHWQPSVSVGGGWWKIDFGSLRDIAAISTQGATSGSARINQYRLEYNDDDSDIWIPYNGVEFPGGEVLNGNVGDATTVVTNQLIPFTCQFLRVRPSAWITVQALRAEFFFDEQANPSQDRAGLGFLVTNFNWGAWLRTNGTSGNGKVRLRTKFYEMIHPIPTNYDSWEPQTYTVEVLPQGVNRRQSVFDFYPALEVGRYVFEGGGSTYLDDTNDKKLNKAIVRNLTDGAGTDPTFSGLQLSHVSIDSIRWPRTINADAVQPSQDDDVHAFELWFRQPDFSQTQCCLIRASNNNRHGIGRGNGGSNFPAMVNNFNALTDWESEIDFYGDNKTHQLVIAHSSDTDYVVYVDGMPVASGTNTGWLDNARAYMFNGEQSNGVDELSRSGGDYGSLTEYKGGVRFTQNMVRKLFEASALNGHQMLTNPQWFILDSDHTTLVGGDPTIAKMDDVVFGQAGINSAAIPRNGKVYFELLFVLQGDNQFGCLPGIRLLTADADVFGILPLRTDGYHLEQSQIFDGHGIRFPDQFVTNNGNIFPPRTGEYYQFAIDWDTGDWWVGHENLWIGGGIVSNAANPSTGAFPLGVNSPTGVAPLDLEKDYCVNIRKLASFGNSETQLVTASADFFNAIPTGFTAWDDAL